MRRARPDFPQLLGDEGPAARARARARESRSGSAGSKGACREYSKKKRTLAALVVRGAGMSSGEIYKGLRACLPAPLRGPYTLHPPRRTVRDTLRWCLFLSGSSERGGGGGRTGVPKASLAVGLQGS